MQSDILSIKRSIEGRVRNELGQTESIICLISSNTKTVTEKNNSANGWVLVIVSLSCFKIEKL